MSSTITTTLPVNGMTCGHCVQAVTSELTQIKGVHDVAVGGRRVTHDMLAAVVQGLFPAVALVAAGLHGLS